MFSFIRTLKSKITFLIFGVIILTLSSCEKTGFGSVEGTVTAEGSTAPVANATVSLYRSKLGKVPELVEQTSTDASGNFKIKYYKKGTEKNKYSLIIESATAYTNYYSSFIETRKSSHTVSLPLKSFLQLKIINNRNGQITVNAASDDAQQEQISQVIGPNQSLVSPYLLKLRTNRSTKVSFTVFQIGMQIPGPGPITVTSTTSTETLIHTITIN